jgi:hypothetical protein
MNNCPTCGAPKPNDDWDWDKEGAYCLVKAAPELLAALKNLTGPGGAIDDHHADFDWLRSLIAKAEGRGE